ncbi:hypothetical protein AWB79_04961 [Caballeronia hypogeia]|uniref:von Willebrand factor type A domain protein n=1 Tax=Caballeronia hypogeia TaxID=1777140 RepID=A0A158C986_9BURK|nr:VWA domain-containing protein [Caballeronia hypogeia]SAK78842.1 hypothetical protein AWB79_04961 [Caballeronia hypogeia]
MSAKRNPGGPSGVRNAHGLFCGDEGAVAMLFAACASLMVGAMCTAIDSIHYEMTQARMQMALDVATLSAGANLAHFDTTNSADLTAWKNDARSYYNINMPSGYMDLSMPDANFSAQVTGTPATGQNIQLSAKGSVPLLAPLIWAKNGSTTSNGSGSGGGNATPTPDTATVSASNSALRLPKSTLELVMVLDNSTSMNQKASSSDSTLKIDGLKAAAKNLVTNLFSQTTNDSYVALVPFTTMVNVGSVLPSTGTTWLRNDFTAYNSQGTNISAWRGCAVEPRDANKNMYPKAYAPKDNPGFTPWYWNVPPAGYTVQNYTTSYDSKGRVVSSCNVGTKTIVPGVPLVEQTNGSLTYCKGGGNTGNIYDWWGQPDAGGAFTPTKSYDQNYNYLTSSQKNGKTTYTQTLSGPCEIAAAQFLSKDSGTLTSSITAMQPNGNTLIPTGLLWGWRMLSSAWSQNTAGTANGFKSTDPTLPRPESTAGLQRVAIVLTDGENAFGSSTGLMAPPYFNGLSGVGTKALKAPTVQRTLNNTMLTDGDMTSIDDINAFQLGVCTAMKQDGVIIYAITFGTYGTDTDSQRAQATMQACASPGNYYHAPSSTTLNTIFQQIAGNLGVLRLTQ